MAPPPAPVVPPLKTMPPIAPVQPPPVAPAEKSGHTSFILAIALLILLALAAGAGYFAWSQGLLDAYMPQEQPVVEETPAPTPTETSDLEQELQSVELGADAQLEAYESQF